LKEYYFWLHPPREDSELEDLSEGVPRDVDFDKLTAAQRSVLGEKFSRTSETGEAT